MKILRDGKEQKDAQVQYDTNGTAVSVLQDGVVYDVKAFELVEGDTKVVNKDDKSKSTVAKPKTTKVNQVLSTKNVPTKKK